MQVTSPTEPGSIDPQSREYAYSYRFFVDRCIWIAKTVHKRRDTRHRWPVKCAYVQSNWIVRDLSVRLIRHLFKHSTVVGQWALTAPPSEAPINWNLQRFARALTGRQAQRADAMLTYVIPERTTAKPDSRAINAQTFPKKKSTVIAPVLTVLHALATNWTRNVRYSWNKTIRSEATFPGFAPFYHNAHDQRDRDSWQWITRTKTDLIFLEQLAEYVACNKYGIR